MKLDETVLLELLDIFRHGIVNGRDISQLLRDIDLNFDEAKGRLVMTEQYTKDRHR